MWVYLMMGYTDRNHYVAVTFVSAKVTYNPLCYEPIRTY